VPLIVFKFECEQNDIFSYGVLARFIQLLCHAFRYSGGFETGAGNIEKLQQFLEAKKLVGKIEKISDSQEEQGV
jgi:hypothetical protein